MSVQSSEAMGSESNPMYIFSHISVLKFQELMAEQDSQYLFELDGNKNADELFKVSKEHTLIFNANYTTLFQFQPCLL